MVDGKQTEYEVCARTLALNFTTSAVGDDLADMHVNAQLIGARTISFPYNVISNW